MSRPAILWLARHLPVPLNAGDRIYTAKLVEALGRAGGDVHFLGLANPDYPDLDANELDPVVRWEIIPGRPRSTVRAMASRRPVVGARFGTPRYEARVRALLAERRYDAVVIDQYALAWALPLIAALPARPAIVHVAHDFETEVTAAIAAAYRGNPVRRLALHLNARRTARAERVIAAASDVVVALTARDCALFQEIGAKGAILVVPPGYDGPRRSARSVTAASERRVGVVGSYQWTAKQLNLAAFLEAADARLAAAGITLDIVGDAPEAFRAAWEGRLRSARFRGFVDDLGAFLDSCRIGLVIEAIGGGFKLKVLDYVMTRTPVAALAPALGGQDPRVVEHFLVRDTADALVEAIVAIIDDVERLNAMQEAAYAAAEPLYSWERNGAALLAAIVAARR